MTKSANALLMEIVTGKVKEAILGPLPITNAHIQQTHQHWIMNLLHIQTTKLI
jgi:hypothetical protein